MNCRHCGRELEHVFLDLGYAPPSNAYLSAGDLARPETTYPLKLFVCDSCWLVQTLDYAEAEELFDDSYAYFSSVSTSWLQHAASYADQIIRRLELNEGSFVLEIASNDGYLLRNFLAAGIRCLGVEPTASTAAAAEAIGIPVVREFFGSEVAHRLVREFGSADLIAANNVYAHVPDINDFTEALRIALKAGGTITIEFPHLMRLIDGIQFDTVYHEHFSYLSLYTVQRIFERAGLRIWDVQELGTHGGSLRIFGCHVDDMRPTSPSVDGVLHAEMAAGLQSLAPYDAFQTRANRVKDDVVRFLIDQKRAGRTVAAYGAAAKGCTLLNYAGIKPDLLPFVCDAAPSKQGKFLPGSHIPIVPPAVMADAKPDIVLILPWNIAEEVMALQKHVMEWGGRFAVAVPSLRILTDEREPQSLEGASKANTR